MFRAVLFIAIGVYLVLNWASIRNYGDNLFGREEQKNQQTEISPNTNNSDKNKSEKPVSPKNSVPEDKGTNSADKLF